jgi:hypothetical protein
LGLTYFLRADRQFAVAIDIGSLAAAGQYTVNAILFNAQQTRARADCALRMREYLQF